MNKKAASRLDNPYWRGFVGSTSLGISVMEAKAPNNRDSLENLPSLSIISVFSEGEEHCENILHLGRDDIYEWYLSLLKSYARH